MRRWQLQALNSREPEEERGKPLTYALRRRARGRRGIDAREALEWPLRGRKGAEGCNVKAGTRRHSPVNVARHRGDAPARALTAA